MLERQDPDVAFITFTGVEVTEDLLLAKVFFSVLGTDEERERTMRDEDPLKIFRAKVTEAGLPTV